VFYAVPAGDASSGDRPPGGDVQAALESVAPDLEVERLPNPVIRDASEAPYTEGSRTRTAPSASRAV